MRREQSCICVKPIYFAKTAEFGINEDDYYALGIVINLFFLKIYRL